MDIQKLSTYISLIGKYIKEFSDGVLVIEEGSDDLILFEEILSYCESLDNSIFDKTKLVRYEDYIRNNGDRYLSLSDLHIIRLSLIKSIPLIES